MSSKPKRARRFWKRKHYRKRKNGPEENSSNREHSLEKSKREIHLEISCIEVSSRLYWDYKARFLLSGIPACLTETLCKHQLNGADRTVKQIPERVESSFKIEYNTNAWYEALEMVQMSITPHQYISPDVLQAIVEIMLNTQENVCEDYSGIHIVSICQQVLAKNFSYHPPCQDKNLRECYIKFLTSPMSLRDQEYTNKIQYEYQKGVVKYCLNRLEHEMSMHSVDGPLMNKDQKPPKNARNPAAGAQWQAKCDNFEFLNRPERIKRLIAVLESIIELLQTDLAICHSKYTYNLGTHILKSEKPLMTFILWPGNIRYCGTVNKNCTQIMRIFVYLCHLEYPSYMLDVVANWLNTMVQTFYLCESNATSDYPHIDKFCNHLASEFYKIITKVSVESIDRVLVRIQPPFMKYHIGMIHIKSNFPVRDDCILKILIRFVKQQQWLRYHDTNEPFQLMPGNHVLKHLFVRLINKNLDWIYGDAEEELTTYSKLGEKTLQVVQGGSGGRSSISLQHAVHVLYLTLEAFLESYNLYGVQKLWCIWNSSILDGKELLRRLKEKTNYSLTEDFIKKYDDNLSALQELQNVYYGSVGKENVPEIMRVFAKLLPLYELEDT
ncbi:hypothetical protein HW555_013274 [Spodoptera exigua]|uniref:Uncharacterized protein n=1 Tax=Spodoptera exigua TaxID=7107 RepID=A0A835G5Y4_SPOEX|nr:hypothetical protein HW555_013274 [Spodoptera exigua]